MKERDVEIVKLLAEKVMGMVGRRISAWTYSYRSLDEPRTLLIHSANSPHINKIEGWNPLTSDADALALVDALNPTDFSLEKSGGNWTADFGIGHATSTGRCRAIVLAALKAVGVDMQEMS